MAINLDRIQSALDRFDPDKKKASSNSNDNIVKLEEGQSTIRIVPYKYDEEMPFREFNFHYRINDQTFLCTKAHNNEPCPVCDFVKSTWNEYNNTQDESYKDLAKSLSVSTRVFIPIIVKESPNPEQAWSKSNNVVRWWSVSASSSPRSTYNKILNAAKIALKRNIDITDLDNGMDLIVTVEKGFNGWIYPVDVSLDVTPSPILEGVSKDIVASLIDSVENIDTMFPLTPVDEIKAALESHLDPNSQPDEDSVGTTKSFSSAKEGEDDLPFDKSPSLEAGVGVEDQIKNKFAGILGK